MSSGWRCGLENSWVWGQKGGGRRFEFTSKRSAFREARKWT